MPGIGGHILARVQAANGILVLDKPARISSAGALTRIKCLWPQRQNPKIGHAGTLDPFATGVLLVLVGSATRRCEELMGLEKRYLATIRLGATSATLDPTSEPIVATNPIVPARQQVDALLPRFTGQIMQVPPAYSALKRNGKPLYQLARKGKEIAIEARPVNVCALQILRYEYPEMQIDVRCGRGTYIRSLARDIAQALGTTGYLIALRRTAVGPYSVESAARLDALSLAALPGLLRQ